MTILVVPEPGPALLLHASGELDIAAVPGLLPQVPELLSDASAVVLDLRDVAFFDSSGVRLVDCIARECGRRSAPFRVVAPPGYPARRVLEMVGMTHGLVSDALDQALQAVQE